MFRLQYKSNKTNNNTQYTPQHTTIHNNTITHTSKMSILSNMVRMDRIGALIERMKKNGWKRKEIGIGLILKLKLIQNQKKKRKMNM